MAEVVANCFNIDRRFHRSVMLPSFLNRGGVGSFGALLELNQPASFSQTAWSNAEMYDIAKFE
jgi:hypothetical protein